ncbi:MAG: hypothetical protein KKC14_12105 [Alphaproteobacteria bacterium]|nr:hypothetical protein [Alphaproteobacteria bacterium]
MTVVRTIHKASSLVLAMRAAGGIHARTALDQAEQTVRAARAENLHGQAELFAQMRNWKATSLHNDATWLDLYECSSGLISICDPDEDVHLLRCARLLCEYVARTAEGERRKVIGDLFISTLSVLGDQANKAEVRTEVLGAFEALIPQ